MMSSKITATRSRILEATWKLMEERPGQGVRMADIAAETGISRQALYLHFKKRVDLLIATTRYIDEVKGVDERLAPSRTAANGIDRLNSFITAWGNYIPEIHRVARVLMAAQDSDPDAAEAWHQRMLAVREGCEAAIKALKQDGSLSSDWTADDATDLLWTMLTVQNWEQLTNECGWTTKKYVSQMQLQAKNTFVKSK